MSIPVTLAVVAALASPILAHPGPDNPQSVTQANPRIPGQAQPNTWSPSLAEIVVARGATALENPTPAISHYGYLNDGTMLPAPGSMQSPGNNVEASKTEPDKNTYLVLAGQKGADPDYDYGTHFLFQGHETGAGYITRINLDADQVHRVTLLADTDVNGVPLPLFDGSTWYPWSKHLLFTSENGAHGGVWQATLDVPSKAEDISGVLGRGGYEGIQADVQGQLWIVEDSGGPAGAANPHAKQPNSFIYRFVPVNRHDLKAGGRLQVLQVLSINHSGPIVFHPGNADGDILSQDMLDLHTYGNTFNTRWITIHDTSMNGWTPYDANALAKAAGGTPFKRPENGQFRPGVSFKEFFFTETGDTNLLTEAGAMHGGFGALFRITQSDPASDHGTLRLFYRCDASHSGLDNIAFWDEHRVVAVEDAGDTLHAQRNALDSAYLFDTRDNYGNAMSEPVRILAQGRDASATLDAGLSASGGGFQNEGDNEITGIHVSDGNPSIGGLLGTHAPRPFCEGWRVFYTQQHGDNVTYEVVRLQHGDMED